MSLENMRSQRGPGFHCIEFENASSSTLWSGDSFLSAFQFRPRDNKAWRGKFKKMQTPFVSSSCSSQRLLRFFPDRHGNRIDDGEDADPPESDQGEAFPTRAHFFERP